MTSVLGVVGCEPSLKLNSLALFKEELHALMPFIVKSLELVALLITPISTDGFDVTVY